VADNTYRDGAADIANNEASFINDGGFAIDQVKMNAVRVSLHLNLSNMNSTD
jgi:alkaline phosphatase D